MSLTRPSRLPRLSPTLALLVGLGGVLPAADFVTTLSVPASQTPGGVYVAGAGTVTYTVDFAENVVPGYLTGFLAEDKADVAVTGATSIYDLVNLTGSAAATGATSIKMAHGKQMQVQMTGLTNGQEAALTITQGKFKGVDGTTGALTGNVNAAVAQRKVRVMLPVAGSYHAKIDTPAYSLMESGAVLLSGDFAIHATTPAYGADPPYPDYVMKITGSSSQVNAYTLASGAWTAIVPAPANFGRVTLTATPSDIVNSAGAAGTTPTVAVYVGQKPVVEKGQLTTADTAPYDTTYTSGIIVGHGQPGFSGTAGLPRDIDGTVNGTLDTAGGRIRTKIDIFGADPVANPATPPLITQKTINDGGYGGAGTDANAAWSISSADYGATVLTGTGSGTTYYLRVVTEVVDSDGATGGDVTGVGTFSQVFTFKVSTDAPSAPTVDLDTGTANTQTSLTTSDNTPTINIDLSGETLTASNVQVQYTLASTLTANPSATVTGDTATGWKAFTVNSTSLPGTGASVAFTPITGEALGDGVYKVRAIFTDENGLSTTTVVGSYATLTVGTPVPGLVVAGTTADHKPDVTISLTSGSLTAGATSVESVEGNIPNGQIVVEVKASAGADGTYVPRAGYLTGTGSPWTWTPTVGLPDGSFTFRARWKSADGKTSSYTTVPPVVVVTTPTPVLAPGANLTVTTPSPQVDGNYQYLITAAASDPTLLKPAIKIGAWTDFADGSDVLTGTFTMYGISRGTTSATATPYVLAAVSTPWETANSAVANPPLGSDVAIPGTVTKVGADAVWTPTDAFTNESTKSMYGKWVDADIDSATANDANANNGTEVASLAAASNVINVRVLSAVDAPAVTAYKDKDGNNGGTPASNTIVVSDGALQLRGTGNAGAELEVFLDAAQLASITVPADGNWTYEFSGDAEANTTALLDGTHTVTIRQIDLASTTPSAYATPLTISVDGNAIPIPTITKGAGSATQGGNTADTTPPFEGTAAPGVTVKLYKLEATQLAATGTNNDLQFVSKTQGNAVTLVLNKPAAASQALSVATTGTAPTQTITVNLATSGASAGISTALDVINAIRGDATANALIDIALAGSEANTGAGAITASITASNTSDAGSLGTAVATLTAEVGTGAWSGDLTTALSASGTPGRLCRVFAQATSAGGGTDSLYSDGFNIYVTTPSMTVSLTPILKGDGGSLAVNKANSLTATSGISPYAYAVGATQIILDSGTETDFNTATADALEDINALADVMAGDVVTFAGDTTRYTVVSGLRGAAGTITISPGLKTRLVNDQAMTIESNPKGPSSGITSLSQILLTARFVSGTSPIDEIISSGFPTSAVTVAGGGVGVTTGTVTAVTKGSGLAGQQENNVWTIAVTPSSTYEGQMTVTIPAGAVRTTPNKILDAITVTNEGANYVGSPRLVVGGGAAGSAIVTWTDGTGGADDNKIQVGELAITDPGYGFTSTGSLTVVPSAGSGAAGLALAVHATTGAITTIGGAAYSTNANNLTTKGSGYAVAPDVVFIGGTAKPSTTITLPLATATLGEGADAGKVVSVTFSGAGANYATPPSMAFRTGSGFVATLSLKDGPILYNSASSTYTINIDRTKPVAAWKGIQAGATSLRAAGAIIDGYAFPDTGNYVVLNSTPSETSFIVQAAFSSPLNRVLVPSDLTLVGCSLDTSYDTDGILDVTGTHQNFNIKVKRGGAPSTVTTMSVTVKAAPSYDSDGAGGNPAVILSDTAEPAQTTLASKVFSANVVSVPTAPIIKTLVGVEGTPSRTVSYPCSVTFSNAVSGFLPSHLSVTNGVISKFAGSGKAYTFTLTPGEGVVEVKYLQTSGLTDVAQQAIPDSNVLRRTLDSTQPLVQTVASPVFGQGGAVKPTTATDTYFNATTLAYTGTTAVAGSVKMIRLPVRVTFSEAPKTVPTTSVLATVVTSLDQNLATFKSGATVKIETPTVVADTANKTYTMNLLIPSAGSGKVRLVVPALGVPDNATNQSAASGVYEIEYNYTTGTLVDLSTAPYSNG